MKLAVTGFVDPAAGSVAAANALLLGGLIERGHHLTFFSKPSFVDPRPFFEGRGGFAFVPVDNRITDRLRAWGENIPGPGFFLRTLDARNYNRCLVREIGKRHEQTPFDAVVWLGDYARGRVRGLPALSFAQGPPGTDARSILRRWQEISKLLNPLEAMKWRLLASLRLGPLGRVPFHHSDRIVVGSRQSVETLKKLYGLPGSRIAALPYPIDLEHFRPRGVGLPPPSVDEPLRLLWLGRIIPRKRLDVFLRGAELFGRHRVRCSVVGRTALCGGYEKMLEDFSSRIPIEVRDSISRDEVPDLMARHHALAQPSEEENFGSSVAEAQACGLPVIVGPGNGNADYLCPRDIRLPDLRPESFAEACESLFSRKDPPEARNVSHAFAESAFAISPVASALEEQIAIVAGCAGG